MSPIFKNSVFIVFGIALMYIAEFVLYGNEQMELVKIVVAFVGFASILNGAFGLYEFYKPGKHND